MYFRCLYTNTFCIFCLGRLVICTSMSSHTVRQQLIHHRCMWLKPLTAPVSVNWGTEAFVEQLCLCMDGCVCEYA